MNIFRGVAIAMLFAFVMPAVAQKPEATPAPKPAPTTADDRVTIKTKFTAKDYEDMLERAKKSDPTVDYAAMRMAYTETEDYSPYGGSTERRKMFSELSEKKYKDSLASAEAFLKKNFVDVEVHFCAWQSALGLKDETKTKFHENAFRSLMDAIFEYDGLTAKTAMLSIGISEQYFVMSVLGFQRKSKGLVEENGSMFDVHDSENKDGDTRKFYFNIDKVFGRF